MSLTRIILPIIVKPMPLEPRNLPNKAPSVSGRDPRQPHPPTLPLITPSRPKRTESPLPVMSLANWGVLPILFDKGDKVGVILKEPYKFKVAGHKQDWLRAEFVGLEDHKLILQVGDVTRGIPTKYIASVYLD